jgi:hypothetical protein
MYDTQQACAALTSRQEGSTPKNWSDDKKQREKKIPSARVGTLFQALLLSAHGAPVCFQDAYSHDQLDGEWDQALGSQVRQEVQGTTQQVWHYESQHSQHCPSRV